jgi:hypothetical protein
MFSVLTEKTPRKILICKRIPKSLVSCPPSPPHSNQGGGRRGRRGGDRGRVAAGDEAITRNEKNENGTASFTRRTMITVQITA